MHAELTNMQFTRNTTAIAFKFDCELDDGQSLPKMIAGYSRVEIVSGGKVRARYAYDGSLFNESQGRKLGKTVDLYVENPTHLSACDNSFDMGYWLVIPESVVTEVKPLSYWIDIFKAELKALFVGHSADFRKIFSEMVQLLEIKEISVNEWNQARLEIMPHWKRQLFTSK